MSILVYVSDLMQQLGDFIPFFSFTVAATSAIYTLSLHDALPICYTQRLPVLYGRSTYRFPAGHTLAVVDQWSFKAFVKGGRSEEHTSELQSRPHLVCRLLLEKEKKKKNNNILLLMTQVPLAETRD